MRDNTRSLLEDMLVRCERIRRYTHGISLDDYLENDLIRDGVERNFIALGEMVSRLGKDDPGMFNALDASRNILGLRHRIAHGYDDEINDRTIWLTIRQSVPLLEAELEHLLDVSRDPL